MTILITGGSGILGSELRKLFPNSISPTHEDFDICDLTSVKKIFADHQIDSIIHTAALTTVRGCEENKSEAMKINVDGTRNLVKAFENSNSQGKFVYISTACVFDGHTGMYDEDSIPYPENFYSLTKLLGEYEVHVLKNSLIIRTNFVSRNTWPYEKAFVDRFGTYLFSDQVANGIRDIFEQNLTGTVHVVGDKKLSMYDLAKINTPNIKPMTIDDYSGPKLTIDMSLTSKKLKPYTLEQ